MPKFTLVDGRTGNSSSPADDSTQEKDPSEVLTLLKDYLNISDPAVQQAVADLVAALARVSGG